jgi:hypothetical protein
MKYCKRCGEWKDEGEFGKEKSKKDGLSFYCKHCNYLRLKEYKENHPEKDKEYKKTKAYIETRQRYRNNHKDIIRNYALQEKYGISLDEYLQLYDKQEGICLICHKRQENKNLSVDHNHKTGEIRGLLCNNCNFGLAYFYDDISILEKAIEYLKKFNGDKNINDR